MARFHEIAQELFGYLQSEFGYKVVGAEKTDSGGHVTYVNSNAGVGIKVVYEIPCAFVFVFIYRLVDGELRENRLPIDVDTDVTCFDFNDYLEPALKMKPAYEYGGETRYSDSRFGLRNYTEDQPADCGLMKRQPQRRFADVSGEWVGHKEEREDLK